MKLTTVEIMSITLGKLLISLLILHNQPSCGLAAKLGSRSLEYVGFFGSNRLSNLHSDDKDPEESDNKEASGGSVVTNTDLANGGEVQAISIIVYPWNNHLGRPATMEWSKDEVNLRTCKEIPSRWQGKVRSINTNNNCIVLYSRDRCRGTSRVVKVGSPSHNRLSDICFQRKPISAKPCDTNELNKPFGESQ